MAKNIIIIVLVVLLAAVGGFVALGGKEGVQKLIGSSETSKKEPAPELQIYSIEKVLLTLPEPGQAKVHHAQVDVVLTSFDPKAIETFKKLDPLLRNIIIEVFAEKTFSQLKDTKNFSALQSEVQAALTVALVKYKIEIKLLDVKFSKMVLQ
ncbi:FliL family flagellar biosynthesis protein [Buttiauxella ferragutiae ATCC 51602]|jgi:flagellar FliL protein|uniref:Flagellar protein FliL n=1 Tax=Buttiauxella ferragutiae ATCC 51602 TaxID=1354252 RepID=A0ABX2W8W7_9ENTR|nr:MULTISPECIES: flagellar basal body-associated FliL family protein [Buttiauxella]OAT28115.1 FliL family flagellar biosynthesis protein [Buttiauxella ferragutiae ATCC 51602]TDN49819.1 flagellar FliL protein [Buttiauxella sp. JUb87]